MVNCNGALLLLKDAVSIDLTTPVIPRNERSPASTRDHDTVPLISMVNFALIESLALDSVVLVAKEMAVVLLLELAPEEFHLLPLPNSIGPALRKLILSVDQLMNWYRHVLLYL